MGTTKSKQTISLHANIDDFRRDYESSHLVMLPDELFRRILDFLDKKSIISVFSKTCKYCQAFCLENGYDQLFFFCREGQRPQDFSYTRSTKEKIRELYPLLNSQFSFERDRKPLGILVHVFTRTNSRPYYFSDVISMIVELCDRRNPSEKTPNISSQVDTLKGTLDVSNQADVSKEIVDVPNQADSSKIAPDDVSKFVDSLFSKDLCYLKILRLSGLKISEHMASRLGYMELTILDLQNCYYVDEFFRPNHRLRSRAVFLNVSETSFKDGPAKLVFNEYLEGLSISISDPFLGKDFIIDASQCCKINVM